MHLQQSTFFGDNSCYNKYVKLFFGYRHGSVTGILFNLDLASFETLTFNAKWQLERSI